MNSTVAILKAYGEMGVQAVRNDLQKVSATGKTAASVKFSVTSKGTIDRLSISARPFTSAIETGRGPAKKGGSGSNFLLNLEEWAQARGFQSRTTKKGTKVFLINGNWMSAKSLAHLLNTKGDETYRNGGKEIYSNTLIKLVAEIKAAVNKDFRIKFTSFVKNTLHGTVGSQ